MAHIIRGDRVIVQDGSKFFLAECWSATLRGEVKSYKRSGTSYAREVSQEKIFPVDPRHEAAAQRLLCIERDRDAFVNYGALDELLAALEKEAGPGHPLSSI